MNTAVFWDYKTENIKKTVNVKNRAVMALNISYPVFEQDSKDKIKDAFASKINKFYSHIAEKYQSAVLTKYPVKADKIYAANGGIKLAFVMNFTVSYNTKDSLSVFSDLSYFDGKKKKTVRFSQNWSCEKSAILPASFIFQNTHKAKRYIAGLVAEIANENMKNRNFSYFSDYEYIIKRKFDFDNFYFVPKGAAFFFNAGVLSDTGLPDVFVMPCEKLEGLFKADAKKLYM